MIPSSSNNVSCTINREKVNADNSASTPFSISNAVNRQQSSHFRNQRIETYSKNSKSLTPKNANKNRSKSSSFNRDKSIILFGSEPESWNQSVPSGNVNKGSSSTKSQDFRRRRSFSSNQEESESSKNSIVITNSRFQPEIVQNEILSGISFNDKICFAIPPKLTLAELNEGPVTEVKVAYLLKITREMNRQSKKRKKRNKKINDVLPQKSINIHISRNEMCDKNSKRIRSDVEKLSPMKDVINIEFSSDSIDVVKPMAIEDPVSSREVKDVKKMSPSTLLQFREQNVPENPAILQSLSKLNLLRSKTFKSSPSNFNRDKNVQIDSKRSDRKWVPSARSLNFQNYNESKNFELSKSNEKLRTFENQHSNTFCLGEIKPLMQQSWLQLEDKEEEEKSKEIYENLVKLVQNFDSNFQEQQKNEKKVEDESKKKKKKKSRENNNSISDPNDSINLLKLNFEEYYDETTIENGLKSGSLFKEIIRINQKNYKEAFLFNPNEERDIFIDGVRNRNRALEGDEVVIELYPEEKWKVHHDESVQKCGKVVAISKKNHPRTAVGYLKIVYKNTKIDGLVLWPRDGRLPRIKIPSESCPQSLKIDRKLCERLLFEAKICNWEVVNLAEGVLIQELGEHNVIQTETECILLENHLNVKPLENVEQYLPPNVDQITEGDLTNRIDIRDQCVFSIDPIGARDLDDALSCRKLPNGNYEVGVHIADVSHYIAPDSPIDLDARQKTTSVYLTQKVFHMLPVKLCEICSLTPSKDKLAFSLFLELDEEGEIVDHKFSRTVIRSCVQFTYQHAQMVIDQNVNYDEFPPISNGFTVEDCVNAIKNLYCLAHKIRKRRFEGGALRIDQPKIVFSLDENSLPVSYSLYVAKESNWVIEEYMLIANILTANRLREKLPDLALLRNHSPPNNKALTNVVECLEKIGIYIDTSTAGSIYRSMMKYDGFDEIGMARMAVIVNLLVKPMIRASYVCSVSDSNEDADFWHYALNVPFYTHFTSPIRRYADVVVHRLLASSLGYCELPKWTSEDIQSIAVNCNRKKNSAKKAGEVSSELFLKLYMEKNGPIKIRAVVIDVKEKHFDVIDLSTRTINRVYVDKIKSADVKFENDEGMTSLRVIWKNDGDMEIRQIIQIFTIIDVQMAYNKILNKVTVSLLKPAS